jgi:hypothetical protein
MVVDVRHDRHAAASSSGAVSGLHVHDVGRCESWSRHAVYARQLNADITENIPKRLVANSYAFSGCRKLSGGRP